MTKAVRIENADSGTAYQVVVQTWQKGHSAGDTMVKEEVLPYPTSLCEGLIHDGQYLIITEKTTPPSAE